MINLDTDPDTAFIFQQINSISSHWTTNLLATGSENHILSIFDLETAQPIHQIKDAHTNSISQVLFDQNGLNLYSSSHDGTMKTWDLRKMNREISCSYEIQAHEPKHDEAIHHIQVYPKLPILVSSGADGLIKFFEI